MQQIHELKDPACTVRWGELGMKGRIGPTLHGHHELIYRNYGCNKVSEIPNSRMWMEARQAFDL